MTTFQQLDRALHRRGWSYDVSNEEFCGLAGRRFDHDTVLALVPGKTLDELASYQDDKYDQSPQSREVAQSLAEYVARNA